MATEESKGRYRLYGNVNGWSDFHCFFDTYREALVEAIQRLENGYQVKFEDTQTGVVSELKLRPENTNT